LASFLPKLDRSLPDAFVATDLGSCRRNLVPVHVAAPFSEETAERSASIRCSASCRHESNDLFGISDSQISLANRRTRSRLVGINIVMGSIRHRPDHQRPSPSIGTGGRSAKDLPPRLKMVQRQLVAASSANAIVRFGPTRRAESPDR
jgi:hypothetical protein